MKKTKIKVIVLVLLLIVGGLIYYFLVVHDPQPADNATKQKGAENVAQTTKDNASKTKATSKDGSTGSAEQPESDTKLQGAVLSITSFEQSNGTVRTSATVNKSSVGTCYYGFSSTDTKPVSRINQSESQSGKQVCKIEIPEAEFTKIGMWKMLLSFTQDGAKVEASQDVTIN